MSTEYDGLLAILDAYPEDSPVHDAAAAIRSLRAQREAERGWKPIAEGYKTMLEVSQSNHAIELAAAQRRLREVETANFRLQCGLNIALNIASSAHRGELEWNEINNLRALASQSAAPRGGQPRTTEEL